LNRVEPPVAFSVEFYDYGRPAISAAVRRNSGTAIRKVRTMKPEIYHTGTRAL